MLDALARVFRVLSCATAIGGGALIVAAMVRGGAAADGYRVRVWAEDLQLTGLMLLCLAVALLILSIDLWSRARHATLMLRLADLPKREG